MATSLTQPVDQNRSQAAPAGPDLRFGSVLVSLLTLLALAVHGYHPYAEDGGLYMAGVKHLLNPALYPKWSEFVTEHLRFSLFAPLVAGLVRASHFPLMAVWLLLYIASFWTTLFAAWLLAARCYRGRPARCGAVALLAAWLPIPIAGTSLMLMDPYVSARSLSTPLAVLAMVGVLGFLHPQRGPGKARWLGFALSLGCFVLTAVLHPLMAGYALGFVLLLACQLTKSRALRTWGLIGLTLTAFLSAGVLYANAPRESTAYLQVALTRTYWFVTRWEWYEQFGAVAPIAILAFLGWRKSLKLEWSAHALAQTAAIAGTLSLLIALCFARVGAPTYLVARLQPLRVLQIVYLVMILALGALLGENVLQRKPLRWILTFAVLGATMFYTERQTFPRSAHLEVPWNAPKNGWERAFAWISTNTPVDGLFALDAHYVTQPGEDAQTFRAVAERSALADFSKDGGEASITPDLTAAWSVGQAAQTGLNISSDSARIAALKPLGVTWIVLPTSSTTGFDCAYSDDAVKVCHLP